MGIVWMDWMWRLEKGKKLRIFFGFKYLFSDKWINKMWLLYSMIIKRNEIFMYVII